MFIAVVEHLAAPRTKGYGSVGLNGHSKKELLAVATEGFKSSWFKVGHRGATFS